VSCIKHQKVPQLKAVSVVGGFLLAMLVAAATLYAAMILAVQDSENSLPPSPPVEARSYFDEEIADLRRHHEQRQSEMSEELRKNLGVDGAGTRALLETMERIWILLFLAASGLAVFLLWKRQQRLIVLGYAGFAGCYALASLFFILMS
jgi:hypothetical protein